MDKRKNVLKDVEIAEFFFYTDTCNTEERAKGMSIMSTAGVIEFTVIGYNCAFNIEGQEQYQTIVDIFKNAIENGMDFSTDMLGRLIRHSTVGELEYSREDVDKFNRITRELVLRKFGKDMNWYNKVIDKCIEKRIEAGIID